jgi:zeaxanthin glucosyltransferase
VCNALAMNRDPIAPPPFATWQFRNAWWAPLRNRAGFAISDWLTRPVARIVADYRRAWKLPALKSPDESFSTRAQLCQMPQAFDFPRVSIPSSFHYVGPLRRRHPAADDFPWHRLDGRPLIYASLGTLQNTREPVFRCFAQACRGLDVQLVMSHGGGLSDDQARALPGDPLVVGYAPQFDLLARARLTVTHAGLNTVLDSLANGVPLVTVPITYEQPAIARRVEFTGTGRSIRLEALTPERLRSKISEVLGKEDFLRAARGMAAHIQAAGGVIKAANLIEAGLTTGHA